MHTGHLALHGFEDVRGHLAFEGFFRQRGHGTREVAFLHRAVGHDHHFVDLLRIGRQFDIEPVGLRPHGAGLIADERHLHFGAPLREAQREFAVRSGYRTVRRAGFGYRGTDQGLSVSVNRTGERKIPPPGILRHDKPRLQQRSRQQQHALHMEFGQ